MTNTVLVKPPPFLPINQWIGRSPGRIASLAHCSPHVLANSLSYMEQPELESTWKAQLRPKERQLFALRLLSERQLLQVTRQEHSLNIPFMASGNQNIRVHRLILVCCLISQHLQAKLSLSYIFVLASDVKNITIIFPASNICFCFTQLRL